MRFIATLLFCVIALQAACGFQPSSGFASLSRTKLMEKKTFVADEIIENTNNAIFTKILPAVASTTGLLLSLGIDPAWAAKEIPPDTSYIGKDFTAAFLPAIMVPLVGLVFPAFSMALFFLFSQQDDIESA
mmetsp:Transcript_24748/g.27701  ORF Transcript_24748/g.27701 Transcript_24748/m.27701 type:complete len:131 (-) Transcript_24748:269-661(-)|eukprot:CAMPEP_0170795406 /NCGR_PEP_ID=MMETSP0733-20121128/24104_1 /TAXON_ID=186038 /ORGANISM="Fragilariopsis kerguelensis, Strain L26-C5" /LENGTH=130 /DNA_ID=CAMNT_0011145287 /DNA_START=59 /DNA_END=451 /DNA_ORIENTATION=+